MGDRPTDGCTWMELQSQTGIDCTAALLKIRSTNVSLLLAVSIFRKSDEEKRRDQKQEDGKINTRRKVLRSRQQRVELEDLEDINYINYVFMTTSAQDRSQATTSSKSIKK